MGNEPALFMALLALPGWQLLGMVNRVFVLVS
jgi:hypothetical protein